MIAYLTAVALAFSYPGDSIAHITPELSIHFTAHPAERDPYRSPWRLRAAYTCGNLAGGRYLPRTAEAVHQFVEEVQATCSATF